MAELRLCYKSRDLVDILGYHLMSVKTINEGTERKCDND